MPAERVAALQVIAHSSPNWEKKDASELQARHDLMRAKLAGFLDRGDTVGRRYPMTDMSLPARSYVKDFHERSACSTRSTRPEAPRR